MFAFASLPLSARVWTDTAQNAQPPQLVAQKHYAVAISESAAKQKGWMAVAQTLQKKYQGTLLTFPDGKLSALLPRLRQIMPHYLCIVSPPEQAGRKLILSAHRVCRRLNQDPYTDIIWGVLTGYEAKDAMRIAQYTKPLVVRRAASSMGPDILKGLEGGFASDEGNKANFWQKTNASQEPQKESVPGFGIASRLAKAFNNQPVDLFVTSGHVRERDWQIIYNVNAGSFRHDHGKLFAIEPKSPKRFYFTSPTPKVYIPAGNCLIGHIDQRDCMATSWMHSGGVSQMIGYTLVTFYGFMGWGTKSYFDEANHTLAESFFATEQALLRHLSIEYPQLLKVNPNHYEPKSVALDICKANNGKFDPDMLGLLWDRDAVAFYGDPAWQTRYDFSKRTVDYKLEQNGNKWTVTGAFRKNHSFHPTEHRQTRPLLLFFPKRLNTPQLMKNESAPKGIILTDLFVMIPFEGEKRKGDSFTFSLQTR